MALNQIFQLTWIDEEDQEHEDFFPTREEAEDHLEYLKEEFIITSHKIEKLPEL